jgi:phosphoglucomutase
MAAVEGFHWEETLTGFKWLGNRALELEGGDRGVQMTVREGKS